jgi:sigma54-dependent transcription regulator
VDAEGELFGHERGAFIGAIAQKIGRMELADQGSLFLDEIGDIPLELQPKLLRSDLYCRLNVVPISIPPLRERPEDIPMLVRHFLRQAARRMNKTIYRVSTRGGWNSAYIIDLPGPDQADTWFLVIPIQEAQKQYESDRLSNGNAARHSRGCDRA